MAVACPVCTFRYDVRRQFRQRLYYRLRFLAIGVTIHIGNSYLFRRPYGSSL